MGRSIEHRSTFGYPAQRVYAALTDESYLRQRLSEIGGPNAELISYTAEGDSVRIVMRQGIDPEDLPGVVRRVVSDGVLIERTETWTSSGGNQPYTCTVDASVKGIKGSITGTNKLSDADGGSEMLASGEVNIDIPLVGGKIEGVIVDQLSLLLDAEATFTNDWLEKH
jgi:Protein of unknown function (DUF2505)